ncbi:MAG: hypothetical protein AAFZ65_00595 [Planctomycetota bacterium]
MPTLPSGNGWRPTSPTMARRIEHHFVEALTYLFYAVLVASTFVI